MILLNTDICIEILRKNEKVISPEKNTMMILVYRLFLWAHNIAEQKDPQNRCHRSTIAVVPEDSYTVLA